MYDVTDNHLASTLLGTGRNAQPPHSVKIGVRMSFSGDTQNGRGIKNWGGGGVN